MRLRFLIFMVLASASSLLSKTLELTLQQQFDAGKISKAEFVAHQLTAIFEPQNLPEKYSSLKFESFRNATSLKFEAKKLLSENAEYSAQLAKFLYRPYDAELDQEIISESGLFKVHYTLIGEHATTHSFAQTAAVVCDSIFDFEINQLGYNPPPSDYGVAGPEWDLYIVNMGYYGATNPESDVLETTRNDYTSWMQMDNDMQSTYSKGNDGIRVTIAHEFFHMIQLGYRGFDTVLDPKFLFENTASWIEDIVYDDLNDYFQYLNSYFRVTDKSFHTFDGNYEYAHALFYKMLSEKYGNDIIKTIWEQFVHFEPIEAIDKALRTVNSTFNAELNEFSIWKLMTGSRADSVNYFSEGRFYPEITIDDAELFTDSLSVSGSVAELATKFMKLSPQASGDFVIRPTFEKSENWAFSVLVDSFDGDKEPIICGNMDKELPNVQALSDVWVCATNNKVPENSYITNPLQYTIEIIRGNAQSQKNEIVSVYPSPFIYKDYNELNFSFRLQSPREKVTLAIYDEIGNLLKTFDIGKCPDGLCSYQVKGEELKKSNGDHFAAGVYLFSISSVNWVAVQKFAIIR